MKSLWLKITTLRIIRFFREFFGSIAERVSRPRTIVFIAFLGYVSIYLWWEIIVNKAPPTGTSKVSRAYLDMFLKDMSFPLFLWVTIVGVIMFVAPFIINKWKNSRHIRKKQKERIRLLDNFEPTPKMLEFFDDRSIYNAIISLLERLDDEKKNIKNSSNAKYKVHMLLCSPALDYWHNSRSYFTESNEFEWGLEFNTLVGKLVKDPRFYFDICHLPTESFSGVNAMKDFIAALANYIVQTDKSLRSADEKEANSSFKRVYDSLWKRSKDAADEFYRHANHDLTKHRFSVKTHNINIPFQIVLVNSNDFTEVVVSFAGREVLERELKAGVKGFFSSDPFVVKTFQDVFNTYVESRDRIPYIPIHTLDIAADHDAKGDHLISSFYFDFVKDLHVIPGTFSPVIGNSSKFTVWVLDKLLTTGSPNNPDHWCNKVEKILDVGSGTGIQALAVDSILRQRLNRSNYSIVAVDSCPNAQQLLEKNLNGKNIKVLPWELGFNVNEDGDITSSWFYTEEKTRKTNFSEKDGNFDLIIADLPFVHAKKRPDEIADLRFLDFNHQLHQALMWIIHNTDILAPDGLLVTAFSSLGGPEDIAEFERHIRNNSLQVIQRVDFYESDYMWMVYTLMKIDDYEGHGDRLWWKYLGADINETTTIKPDAKQQTGT
ncbi:MAG: hypothetical protein AB2697_16130 [Candidatus Thiodiazotropha endolucinida]